MIGDGLQNFVKLLFLIVSRETNSDIQILGKVLMTKLSDYPKPDSQSWYHYLTLLTFDLKRQATGAAR